MEFKEGDTVRSLSYAGDINPGDLGIISRALVMDDTYQVRFDKVTTEMWPEDLEKVEEGLEKDKKPGFKKFDDEKPRTDLIPPKAIMEVAKVLGFGARKYGATNWNKCPDFNRYVGASLRHIFQHMADEVSDEESGCAHLAHAITSLLFVLEKLKEEE